MSVDPRVARMVADADVLAADLLVGDSAREAMDVVRAHDWLELVASDHLLEEATGVIADLADRPLADAWRGKVEGLVRTVSHPPDDHPGVAAAIQGDAGHLLSLDPELVSPEGNARISGRADLSIRRPAAFVSIFDPADMYELVVGGRYPGPDRDPCD
ncbi:MAG: hypothetical protein ABEJ71_00630 [Halodesulfurarchaeum sp.]